MNPLELLRRIGIWVPVAIYLFLIFYFSSLSRVRWATAYPDFLLHGLEYLGLAVLLVRALNRGLATPVPRGRQALTLFLCTLCGTFDEAFQMLTPDRLADYRDVISDATGAAIGLLLVWLGQRLLLRRPRGDVDEAVLYTKPDCPLCFALHRSAAKAARGASIPLRVIDISQDTTLQSRYGNEVPVLELPGGRRIQGRAAPGEVERAFRDLVRLRRGPLTAPGDGAGSGA